MDDDRLMRLNLRLWLGREGLEVDTAGTCHEARSLLRDRPYGVVVTDLDLPDASGLEVVRWARRLDPKAVIIVITGSASALETLEPGEVGAEAIFLKPFRFDDLLGQVRRALGPYPSTPNHSDA